MERSRRMPAPGVEEALSSMLWTPYARTPSDTSDDEEVVASVVHGDANVAAPVGKEKMPLPSQAAASLATQSTRFARLTRPLSFMDKRKASTPAVVGTDDGLHLYPEPIRYFGVGRQAHAHTTDQWHHPFDMAQPRGLRTSASMYHPQYQEQQQWHQQQRVPTSSQLPSYELVTQERLHRSWNPISSAGHQQHHQQQQLQSVPGIYFIAPSERRGRCAFGDDGDASVRGPRSTMLVNSFTDDFSQYQVNSFYSLYY